MLLRQRVYHPRLLACSGGRAQSGELVCVCVRVCACASIEAVHLYCRETALLAVGGLYLSPQLYQARTDDDSANPLDSDPEQVPPLSHTLDVESGKD